MKDKSGRFIGQPMTEHSCKQCEVIFMEYPSVRKLFCSKDCYSSFCTIGERSGKLTGAERQARYRERNKVVTHNLCVCGGTKMSKAIKCTHCARKDKRPHNYKGGKANHLKHNRERLHKMKIIGAHTDDEWEITKQKFGYMCLCCKKQEPEVKLTRDHIVPISKNGSDFIENIQPLCGPCNSRKYTSIISYIELHEKNKAGEIL